jgi:hypothetical protein
MYSDCFQELSLGPPCFIAVFLGVEIERRLDFTSQLLSE